MSEVIYPVTVAEFKTWFTRDFPFSESASDLTGITDTDITKAFAEAMFVFNKELFTEDEIKTAFMYVAAHYLVIDIANSTSGLSGRFQGFMSSKSVGSVSVSYSLPSWITDNPLYSMLGQTPYGAKYLSLMIARCIGNVGVLKGATHP